MTAKHLSDSIALRGFLRPNIKSEVQVSTSSFQSEESSYSGLSSDLPSADRLQRQTLKQVVESYLRYYAEGQGHTARAKQYDLKYFVSYLAESLTLSPDLLPVSAWTLQATKNYIDYRLSLGESPATVNRRLATIKHFGRTLAERVHGFINPAREVKGPTLKSTKPHSVSKDEIVFLRQAAWLEVKEKNDFASFRNRFLLELLLATGLRADEIRLLLMGQLDQDCQWLKNVRTKGRKFRNVYVDSDARPLCAEYLENREKQLLEKFPLYSQLAEKDRQRYPVLISLYGAELTDPKSFGLAPKTIWRIVSDWGKKAQSLSNVSLPNLHPHKLRHTFAHGLLDSSKDVRLVAQALGHSDVRTTMRYTERSEEELAKAIEIKITGQKD